MKKPMTWAEWLRTSTILIREDYETTYGDYRARIARRDGWNAALEQVIKDFKYLHVCGTEPPSYEKLNSYFLALKRGAAKGDKG
jgi:hypothetical protein